jgi:hypothetical protein
MRANLSLCRGEEEEETIPRRGEEPEVQGKNAQSSAVAMPPFVFVSLLSLSLSLSLSLHLSKSSVSNTD